MAGIGLIFVGLIAGIFIGWLIAPNRTAPVAELANEVSALSNKLTSLRHDLRSQLAPAMLRADQLSEHTDEAVSTHAATIRQALETASAQLRSGEL